MKTSIINGSEVSRLSVAIHSFKIDRNVHYDISSVKSLSQFKILLNKLTRMSECIKKNGFVPNFIQIFLKTLLATCPLLL
ncbi:Uncharacterised protein [Atlantibacter hermannii]|nr:Uncharacterised protein [Atlantibacter hermannii]